VYRHTNLFPEIFFLVLRYDTFTAAAFAASAKMLACSPAMENSDTNAQKIKRMKTTTKPHTQQENLCSEV
jgi:hypothetical protein